MAGKEYILTKEPDALYEVTYILDAALGPGEGRDPGWADIGHAAEHYARRFGLSRAACEKWFTPLREIEQHVIEGLGLSEEVLRRDYRAPNEALSTPSALVRLAMEHDLAARSSPRSYITTRPPSRPATRAICASSHSRSSCA